jgi:hypothetical protein
MVLCCVALRGVGCHYPIRQGATPWRTMYHRRRDTVRSLGITWGWACCGASPMGPGSSQAGPAGGGGALLGGRAVTPPPVGSEKDRKRQSVWRHQTTTRTFIASDHTRLLGQAGPVATALALGSSRNQQPAVCVRLSPAAFVTLSTGARVGRGGLAHAAGGKDEAPPPRATKLESKKRRKTRLDRQQQNSLQPAV